MKKNTDKKKNNMFKEFRENVKEFSFSRKNKEVPPILYSRYSKLLMFAVGSAAASVAAFIVGIGTSLMLFGVFIALAAVFLFLAVTFKSTIDRGNFKVYSGEVTYVKEMLSASPLSLKERSLRRPSYYHVRTFDGDLYHLPAHKQNAELPLGSKIAFYTPKDAIVMERNGVYTAAPVWAYELKDEMVVYGTEE